MQLRQLGLGQALEYELQAVAELGRRRAAGGITRQTVHDRILERGGDVCRQFRRVLGQLREAFLELA